MQLAELGFTHVDMVAVSDRPLSHLEALADSGLVVSCVSLGRALPEGYTLDGEDSDKRRTAVEMVKQHINDAARLGATCAYIVPGKDDSPNGLLRLADSCAILSVYAGSRMIPLCIEHFPGSSLPSANKTLSWLNKHRLDSTHLLMDVGHCLISEEDPAKVAHDAGTRLGYVHFNDNDSVDDLHWPLLSGRLTQDMLDALVAELLLSRYPAALSLELNPNNSDPVADLAKGKRLLEQALRQRVD